VDINQAFQTLRADSRPRLLLSITDERCPLCRCQRVHAYPTEGLERASKASTASFCLNPDCAMAVQALPTLNALKTLVKSTKG
jgi:hypothetical protein